MKAQDKIALAQTLDPKLAKYLGKLSTAELARLRIVTDETDPELMHTLRRLCDRIGIAQVPHLLVSNKPGHEDQAHRAINTVEISKHYSSREGRDFSLGRQLVLLQKARRYAIARTTAVFLCSAIKSVPGTVATFKVMPMMAHKLLGLEMPWEANAALTSAGFIINNALEGGAAKGVLDRAFAYFDQYDADRIAAHTTGHREEALADLRRGHAVDEKSRRALESRHPKTASVRRAVNKMLHPTPSFEKRIRHLEDQTPTGLKKE